MNYEEVFSHAVARVKTLENRLMDTSMYNRLIDADNLLDMYKIMAETDYMRYAQPDEKDFENIIFGEQRRVNEAIFDFSYDGYLSGLFYAKYDFENAKVLLKAALLGNVDVSKAINFLGFIKAERIGKIVDRIMETEGINTDLAFGETTIKNDDNKEIEYITKAVNASLNAHRTNDNDPQIIDIIIDKAQYEYFLDVAKSKKALSLLGLIVSMIDMTNVRTFARMKNMEKASVFLETVFLKGGSLSQNEIMDAYDESNERIIEILTSTPYMPHLLSGLKEWVNDGSLRKLEDDCNSFIDKEYLKLKYVSGGYEPVLLYLYLKQKEADTLRRIFTWKQNGLSSSDIREGLGGAYA